MIPSLCRKEALTLANGKTTGIRSAGTSASRSAHEMSRAPRLKWLVRMLGALLSAVLLALAAISLILARPQAEEEPAAALNRARTAGASASRTAHEMQMPRQNASPALEIHAENELTRIISDFPAPVMSFMSGSGMIFVSGVSSDAAVSGGFGRIATLWWQTPEGDPLIVQSIWPASAISLLEGGYHFSSGQGSVLLGNLAVRMENDNTIRLHTATLQGLYALILPRSLADRQPADEKLTALCRSLQIYTAQE